MKIPVINSCFDCDDISDLGDNYGKTEKFADNVLKKLLVDAKYEKYSSILFVGTTVGGLDRSESEYLKAKKTGEINSQKFIRHEADEMTKFLAKKYNFSQNFTISAACSSGLHAIGLAKKAIESERFDFAAAVGTDALCELTKRGFEAMMLIDPSKSAHPFDKNRGGIRLGEGAGAVSLISPKICEKAQFYIAGYGSSCDAYHATAPDPSGKGAITAIKNAVQDANISPNDIDWICSHGTGTLDNDLAEVNAYRAIFGDNIPPFFSFKGKIGHTLAASGAIETALVIDAMKQNIIPVSSGFSEIDENIGISPTTHELKKKAKYVLKTAFGFGGNNAAIIIAAD